MRRHPRHEACLVCDIFELVDQWGPAVDIPSPHIPLNELWEPGDSGSWGVPRWHPEGSGGGLPGSIPATEGDVNEERQEGNPHGGEGT